MEKLYVTIQNLLFFVNFDLDLDLMQSPEFWRTQKYSQMNWHPQVSLK